jgi:hypothetical protein
MARQEKGVSVFHGSSVTEIRSWSLSDEITLQQLLEVQEHFGLPSPALVEKDFHVVKVLAAIAAVETPPVTGVRRRRDKLATRDFRGLRVRQIRPTMRT